MAVILLAIIIGFWVYRSVKRFQGRYEPSVPDGIGRIVKGAALFLIGVPLFLGALLSTPKQPDINVVDVLLVFPLIIKAAAGDVMKGIGESAGLELAVVGAALVIWGILEVKHSRSTGSPSADEKDLAEALDDLDRQLSDGLITDAEYDEKKRRLLCGTEAERDETG
ncbi:MAG: SHOCT domain-containing protein [Oscillospiraceae bacterium]|jgi:hypothetical protein|nr:SHOCT domain-containing protein [Oscillospiraceae bacterium]